MPSARSLVPGKPFDWLISDQMMPRMDGWQLLASVRVRWPQLPVLLYSAAPPLRDGNWPEALAFDACLLKPASSGELLAVIAGLLRIPQAATGASGTPVNAQMG
ncbi:response regulator [Pseudomonas putida]|uniref:response regulator n=1 Tax=Pseudomonas putida TaxID=303 RepID=UPI0023633695|nr:response regulator [Pseudomonas putida]MDD2055743.1 response regulator [Pseudomonas putida]